MRFISTLAVAFASCVFAADYTTILGDITTFGKLVSILQNDTDLIVPGVYGVPYALQVEVDAVNLDNAIISATNDANASPPFGDQGSYNVSIAILNFEPVIKASLDQIASKNTTFGDLGLIVLSSLYQLKADTDVFGKAVTAKLASAEAGVAPTVIAQIDGYFNNAIQAYGGKTTSS